MPDPQTERIAKEVCARHGFVFEGHSGSGSFKEVFRVKAPDGSLVAIKISKPQALSIRNQREVEVMRRLDHPSIAKLFVAETVQDGLVQFLVTHEEWLGGGSLTDRAQQVSANEIFTIGCALLQALTGIWELGLVHRDIKPDNIMFRAQDGSPVLTDFGIVRDLSAQSLTQTSAWMGPGTPLFASPEQLNNDKALIDARSDQFGLAAALYFSATGRHPYQGSLEDLNQAINNTSLRQGPSNAFTDWIVAAGLPVLAQMVAPWPIKRFRFPDDLIKAWSSQTPN